MEIRDMSKEALLDRVAALQAETEQLKESAAERGRKIKLLREDWKRLQRNFDEAPISLIQISAQGKIKGANRAGRKLFAAADGRFRNGSFAGLFFDQNDGAQFFELLLRDGSISDMETKLKNEDGSARSVFLQASTAGFGGTGEACAAIYDLTHIRQTQGHMPELFRDGQLLFAKIPIGIFLTGLDGTILAANDALQDSLGYSAEELKKINMFNLYANQLDRLQLLEKTVRSGRVRDFETQFKRKDGSIMTVLLSTDLIDDREGKQIFISSIRDISEYREVWDDLRLEMSIMRAVRETTQSLILVLDREGSIIRFSGACEASTGFEAADVAGKRIWEVFPKDLAFSRNSVREMFEKKNTGSEEHTLTAKNGETLTIFWSYTMVRDQDDRLKFLVASGNDITKRRAAEDGMREANEKLRSWIDELEIRSREIRQITEMGEQMQSCANPWEVCAIGARYVRLICPSSRGAIYLINSSRNLVEAAELWGAPPDSLPVFQPNGCWALRRGRPNKSDGREQGLLCEHIIGAEEGQYLCLPLMANGESMGLLYMSGVMQKTGEGNAYCLNDDHKYQMILTIADYVALALTNLKLRETLRQQSIRDPLTGLYNRRYLEETFGRELRREERDEKPVGVMMLDIDHFKQFNDTYGHDGGDALLRELGALMKNDIRGGDVVARFGGEEFVIILPGADLAETRKRAEEIREAVEKLQVFFLGKMMRQCTISIGVSAYPRDGVSTEELIRKADAALYRAKHAGRNRVVEAGEED